ncbi:hypothetical protein Dimus_005361, partial [Dionaea muscipula]
SRTTEDDNARSHGRCAGQRLSLAAALGFAHADDDDHGRWVVHQAWVRHGRRCGGSRVRRRLRARAGGGVGHEPGRMPIGLPGTKAPLVTDVLLLAAVHGGWWHWRLAVVAVLGS